MPLYEYRCTDCGNRFEKIQKFNAEPEVACPKCGGELERPLTAPALQFKGAGWYVNDYAPKGASSSNNKPGESTAAPAAESKPGSETKAGAESKPASDSKPAGGESSSKPAAAPSGSSVTT